MQNWMLRDIYMETFEVVAKLVDHPYTNVRLKVWGSLISWDTTVSSAKLVSKVIIWPELLVLRST